MKQLIEKHQIEDENSLKYHKNGVHIGSWSFKGEKGSAKLLILEDGSYIQEVDNDLYGHSVNYGNWYIDASSVTSSREGSWIEFIPQGRAYPLFTGRVIKDGNCLYYVVEVGGKGEGYYYRF